MLVPYFLLGGVPFDDCLQNKNVGENEDFKNL